MGHGALRRGDAELLSLDESKDFDAWRVARTLGGIALLIVWVALMFGGFTAAVSDPEWRLKGSAMVLVAVGTAILLLQHWVPMLQSLFGAAFVNALGMIATGHAVSDVARKVDLSTSIGTATFALASAVLAHDMAKRKVTMVDRFAVAGVLVAFLCGVFWDDWGVLAFAGCSVCLGISWICARRRQRNR